MQIKLNRHRKQRGAWILLLIFAAGVLVLGGCIAGKIIDKGKKLEAKLQQAQTNLLNEAVVDLADTNSFPQGGMASPPTATTTNFYFISEETKDPWYDESGF